MKKTTIFFLFCLVLTFSFLPIIEAHSYETSVLYWIDSWQYTSNSSDFWDDLDTPANLDDLLDDYYVPYIGATTDIDLGIKDITTSGTYDGLSIIQGSDWIYLSGDGSIESGFDIAIPRYGNRDFYYGYGGIENHYFGEHGNELIIDKDGNLITTGDVSAKDITADYFFGSGANLYDLNTSGIITTESDPIWQGNSSWIFLNASLNYSLKTYEMWNTKWSEMNDSTFNQTYADYDFKIKVSVGDTTPAYIGTKLIGGTGINIITVGIGDQHREVVTDDANIDHDALNNYVANEHIDWTGTSSSFSTSSTGYFGDDLTVDGDLNVTGTIINPAIYAQLSDLQDQTFPAFPNEEQPINLTTTDEINGLSVSVCNVSVLTSGVYSIFAQPQVTIGAGQSGKFHMWLEKWEDTRWIDVSNSNVELSLSSQDEDVIVLIVTMKLNVNEKIRVMGSVSNTNIKLDAQTVGRQPNIPSIIFTMYRIGS